jgi:hypothetical protein
MSLATGDGDCGSGTGRGRRPGRYLWVGLCLALYALALASNLKQCKRLMVYQAGCLVLWAGLCWGVHVLARRRGWRVGQRWSRWVASHTAVVCISAAALATAFAATATYSVLSNVHHSTDESAYAFQATIFARGELRAPAPAWPMFFWHWQGLWSRGQWYTICPPGWPVLLAPWLALALPAAGAWVWTGLAVLSTCWLAWEVLGRRGARLAALLGATSPLLVFSGGTLLTHNASLALTSAALALAVGARRGAWIPRRGSDGALTRGPGPSPACCGGRDAPGAAPGSRAVPVGPGRAQLRVAVPGGGDGVRPSSSEVRG